MYDAAPAMTIDVNNTYIATMQTEKGDIKIRLLADQAPITVNSFVFLARQGYYDNTTFHRVLNNFMAQGGELTGTLPGTDITRNTNGHPDINSNAHPNIDRDLDTHTHSHRRGSPRSTTRPSRPQWHV